MSSPDEFAPPEGGSCEVPGLCEGSDIDSVASFHLCLDEEPLSCQNYENNQ